MTFDFVSLVCTFACLVLFDYVWTCLLNAWTKELDCATSLPQSFSLHLGLSLYSYLRHLYLLALHRAEEEGLHHHEALSHQALGAAGALEALWLSVPVVFSVGNPLSLRLHYSLAGCTFHSMVLHVAGLADRFVVLHDVRLSSQDTVTVKTAEVFQMPVLTLSLSILITEDQLITSGTPWLLAVSIVSSTVQFTLFPEVDHVHQQFFAGAAYEAGRVPQFVIAGSFSIHGRVAKTHGLLAVIA